MRGFENETPKRTFGPKKRKEDGKGENYIMRSFIHCTRIGVEWRALVNTIMTFRVA